MKNLKRVFTLLMALVMALSLSVAAFAAVEDTGFSDVAAGAWYAEAVQYCRDNGIMSGTSATTFSPSSTMTRAMLATVLYRAAGSPSVTNTNSFSDVASGAYYANAVSWASENGIMAGYGNGIFGSNDPVTREQIAAILWRYEGSPAPSGTAADYADQSSIASYAVDAATWARENGVMNGKDGNRFDPKSNATRAEVAVILMNDLREEASAPTPDPEPSEGGKVLVAYFSATGNTEGIAEHLRTILDADLYEIVPQDPYTSADLNYNDNSCRANQEQNDPEARPAISGSIPNMDDYDVIFLGYPIWHGQAPKIIYTFLENYDLSGKTIVPFCTSGSSPIGTSATNMHDLAPGANWLSGQRFSGSAGQSTLEDWVNGLDLPDTAVDGSTTVTDTEVTNRMYIQVSGAQNAVWTATLVDNSSAAALAELLEDGPLTIEMSDYGSMEKVGPIGQSLPTNNQQISTTAGDIILYQGSSLVIYYDTNSWNFTRLGRVDNVTQAEMRAVFGTGDVTVTLSLDDPAA